MPSGSGISEPQNIMSAGTIVERQPTIGTTTMVNDTPEISSLPFRMKEIVPGLLSASQANVQNTIADFLAKPVLVKSVAWTQAGAANDILTSANLPWGSTGADESTMWREKLKGFLGFRATAHINVHVNASRQAQGRLLLHYIPLAPEMTSNVIASRNFNLMTKTQQVSVDLSVNSGTTMSLSIPYVHPRNFYNLETKAGQFGTWYLSIYDPYYSSVAGDLNVDVWVHFTDVELAVPTLQVVTQANPIKEVQQNQNAPLSGPLKTVARGLGQLSMIPSLSALASPASWVVQALARTAQAFGYSKPLESVAVTRVKNTLDVSALNYDIADTSYPLAFSSQNHVSVLPGFAGVDIDEMSISYICSRPAHYATVLFPGSAVREQSLGYVEVEPGWFTNAYGGLEIAQTPLSYIANMFTYWRGGITIHLKITKTEFHTGRLIFCFKPGSTGSTPSIADSNYLFREILDLRLQDEFHITIPYTSLRPWMRNGESTGRAFLLVETPLKAPTNVSPDVNIHWEVSGADDIAFAAPANVSYTPLQIGTVLQMNDPYASTIGNSKDPNPNIDPDQYCIGERILSIKQLMLRKSRLNWSTVTTSYKVIAFNPYETPSALINSSTYVVSNLPMLSGDYYGAFAGLFALSRGSVRVKACYPNVTWTRSGFAMDQGNTFIGGVGLSTSYVDEPCTGYIEQSSSPPHLQVPAYSQHHSRPNRLVGEGVTYNYGSIDSRVRLYIGTGTAGALNDWQGTRAVSDDFAFGLFIGAPLTYIRANPIPTFDS